MDGSRWLCVFMLLLLTPRPGATLPLSEYHAQKDDTLDLFVSGSSAQDNTLEQLFRFICEPNSLDIYRSNGGNVRLLFCRTPSGAGAVPGFPGGQKVAFHKSSIGGSGSGVGPLIQLATVEFLNVLDVRAHFDERCPTEKRKRYSAEGTLPAYTVLDCLNPTPAREVPDVGISDVEPRFFLDLYHLPPSAVDALTVTSVNAFIFGVPVNLSLRNALQAARFPRTHPCNPANPHYGDFMVVDSNTRARRGETERCMPGFTRAQVAGIFAGTLTEWGEMLTPTGYPLASKNPNTGRVSTPAGVEAPSDDHIYVCRRVDTSGTQASYEMFFLNQRCASGVHPFVKNGAEVFMGSGTTDVKACLNQLDQQKHWAVGIMSTENVASAADDRWRFVKLDGVAPTLLNTFSGRWPFFVEQSYQWRSEHAEHPLTGPRLGLMSQIALQLKNPIIVNIINRDFRHPWGNAGVMALSGSYAAPPRASPGRPVDAAVIAEHPLLAVTHDGNNCGAVLAQYPTTLP
ncbi:MAG: hypothetical protein ACLPTF_08355 [Steroidobacteraceae bacterium]